MRLRKLLTNQLLIVLEIMKLDDPFVIQQETTQGHHNEHYQNTHYHTKHKILIYDLTE